MEEESHGNGSFSGGDGGCLLRGTNLVSLALVNVFTFAVGQPVTAKLLFITFSAKKSADILNCNLALFHNFLYLCYGLNFILLASYRRYQPDLFNILFIYNQVGGPMGLCFICMERYVAVIHPTSYPLLKRYRWREVCALMVWLCSLSLALTDAFAKHNISRLAVEMIRNVPSALMLLVTHVMLWCTVRIARALKRSSPGRDRLHPVKRKAFRIVCATTAINVLCYIPVTVMQRLKYHDEYLFRCTLTPISILVLSAAAVVHPLFYLSTKGKLLPLLDGHKESHMKAGETKEEQRLRRRLMMMRMRMMAVIHGARDV